MGSTPEVSVVSDRSTAGWTWSSRAAKVLTPAVALAAASMAYLTLVMASQEPQILAVAAAVDGLVAQLILLAQAVPA